MDGVTEMGEARHPGSVGHAGSTVPASPQALRRVGVAMVETSGSILSGTRRLSLMSGGVPVTPPTRFKEEGPPTMLAFAGQLRVVHQVEIVAMNDDDTDTLVSESSTRAVTRSQHESEHEEEQFWERNSAASGISDVEVVAEAEHENSAVEAEIEVEAAQSRSKRIRAAFRELDGVDVRAMF